MYGEIFSTDIQNNATLYFTRTLIDTLPCVIFPCRSSRDFGKSVDGDARYAVIPCFPEALHYDLRCGKLVSKWASRTAPEADANLVPEPWFQERACRPIR